jgi:outer membrane lipoprotein SlyB
LRVDKTFSELWHLHLRGNLNTELMTTEEYQENEKKEVKDISLMAINTIKKLQRRISELELENDQLKGISKFS